jgi:hypothetical protein
MNYEFDTENWYAPANLPGADPGSRIQLDVITPQKQMVTPEEACTPLDMVSVAVRSVFGPGQLPIHEP